MKRRIFKLVSKGVLHPYFRLRRGLTLGVRVAVRDPQGRVLLVRHTYAPGWMFPGGGVEQGETATEAAVREIHEEAGIVAQSDLKLFGLYGNDHNFAGDHVALYILDDWRQERVNSGLEISAHEFFARDALPSGTTIGTRRRLEEIDNGQQEDERW
ncbi:MAG: NUDIX domain-containing protein [Hyphomicrobiales bacterium]